MKRTLKERLGDFVLGKGFYIVLFLCVATIGISGYYLIQTASRHTEPLEPVTGNPTVVLPDANTPAPAPSRRTDSAGQTEPAAASAPKAETDTGTPRADSQSGAPAETASPDPSQAQQAGAAAVYTWPVKGEILSGFSLEVLAYDETMGDWRTHSGVDIAAPAGTRVLAISDGAVQAVYEDELMGYTVVIDHGNGVKSTYCNLSQSITVAQGDEVETGTVIGTVGQTAMAESGRPAHLHLEMERDGLSVDPINYLPQ